MLEMAGELAVVKAPCEVWGGLRLFEDDGVGDWKGEGLGCVCCIEVEEPGDGIWTELPPP